MSGDVCVNVVFVVGKVRTVNAQSPSWAAQRQRSTVAFLCSFYETFDPCNLMNTRLCKTADMILTTTPSGFKCLFRRDCNVLIEAGCFVNAAFVV